MKDMMKLFSVCLLIALTISSCLKESGEFIPDEIPGPINNLRNLISSESQEFRVSNNLGATLTSSHGVELIVEPMTFMNNSEGVSSSIKLDHLEMTTLSDFILQEVDNSSDLGFTHSIYSFYLDASYLGNEININEDRVITLRIPSNELYENLVLGKGEFNSTKLRWNYNLEELNSQFEFTTWEEQDTVGGIKLITGYEITVNETGWYNLVSKVNNPNNLEVPFCIDFPDNSEFNSNNTVVYTFLSEDKFIVPAYLSKINEFCTLDLPYLEEAGINILSISHLDGKNEFYYSLKSVELSPEFNSHSVNPKKISSEDLKELLLEL